MTCMCLVDSGGIIILLYKKVQANKQTTSGEKKKVPQTAFTQVVRFSPR